MTFTKEEILSLTRGIGTQKEEGANTASLLGLVLTMIVTYASENDELMGKVFRDLIESYTTQLRTSLDDMQRQTASLLTTQMEPFGQKLEGLESRMRMMEQTVATVRDGCTPLTATLSTNDVTEHGAYYLTSATDTPEDAGPEVYITVVKCTSEFFTQTLIAPSGKAWVRVCCNGQFQNWKRYADSY